MYILCYHNVVADELDAFDKRAPRVTRAQFEREMQYVARFFQPVSLPRMLAALDSGEPEAFGVTHKSVAVTFDDGYWGVYAYGWPVLRGLGIPATVYVVTRYAGGGGLRVFPFDEIEIAFRITEAGGIDLGFLGLGSLDLHSPMQLIACMKAVKKKLKLVPAMDLAEARALLFQRLGTSPEDCRNYSAGREKYRQMEWNQLKELQAAGWTIGSHTRTHQAIAQLHGEERESELGGARDDLRRQLQLDSIHFAYPYGEREHIGADGAEAVRAAGYSSAVTTFPGEVALASDRFLLKRVGFEQLIVASP